MQRTTYPWVYRQLNTAQLALQILFLGHFLKWKCVILFCLFILFHPQKIKWQANKWRKYSTEEKEIWSRYLTCWRTGLRSLACTYTHIAYSIHTDSSLFHTDNSISLVRKVFQHVLFIANLSMQAALRQCLVKQKRTVWWHKVHFTASFLKGKSYICRATGHEANKKAM